MISAIHLRLHALNPAPKSTQWGDGGLVLALLASAGIALALAPTGDSPFIFGSVSVLTGTLGVVQTIALIVVLCRSVKPNSSPDQTPTSSLNRTPASYLVAFYKGESPNIDGVTLQEIQTYFETGERPSGKRFDTHKIIQWIFPLPTRSMFNGTAPLLNQAVLFELQRDAKLQVRSSFTAMLAHYGIEIQTHQGSRSICRAANWDERKPHWLTPRNHNFLRITRIIHFLKLMNLDEEATMFHRFLHDLSQDQEGACIGERTLSFWTDAVNDRLQV